MLFHYNTNAQTIPNQPFTHAPLPPGWSGPHDVTEQNKGLFKVGFEGVRKGEGGFGFVYEGAILTVEQTMQSLDEWKAEMYRHLSGQNRGEDSYQRCVCTRRSDNPTKVSGFPAYTISEIQRCYRKADGAFDDEDVHRVYYIQVGKAAYYIYTESDSETEGGTDAYELELDAIINGLSFFGGGGSNTNTNTNDDNNNTNTNTGGTGDDPFVTPGGGGGSGGNDDWSVGEVLVGVLVGGGAAAGIGWGIKAIAGAAKTGAKTLGGTGKTPSSPQPSKPQPDQPASPGHKPPKRPKKEEETPQPEDEDQPEEDEKEPEEEESYRYVLQINKNQFELGIGQEDLLQVRVWRTSTKGERSLAENASITLRPHSTALSVEPSVGSGSLDARLRPISQADTENIAVDIMAQAGGSALRSRVQVRLKKSQAKYEFISTQVPPDKTELVPDNKDVWYFYVQVRNTADDDDPQLAKLNAAIRIDGTGTDGGWLNLGEQRFIDGWQAVGFTASNPQPHLAHPAQVVRPPKTVGLQASVTLPDGQVLQKVFDFKLQQPAVLNVDNDSVYFPALPASAAGTQPHKHIDIVAFIEDAPEGETWNFTADYQAKQPRLTGIEILPRGASSVIVRLKTPTKSLPAGQGSEFSQILIQAKSNRRKAFNDRLVNVTLRAEGIFIVKGTGDDGVLQIWGDPDKEAVKAELAVYVWDQAAQAMRADRRAVEHLKFDFDTPNQSDKRAKNMLSVAELNPKFDYIKGDNQAQYLFRVANEIPGMDELFPFLFLVKAYSEITRQEYELEVRAGIFGQGIGPSSEDWQREYDNCLRYIERHVPKSHQPDMRRMVEERKMSLGHEGLYHLRHKIHSITMNLILAEGAEGYRQAEKWYTDVIEMLEWCKWAGNLAFNAVAASVFGPYAPAVTIAKSYGIQALEYVLEGKTLEQWVYDTFTLHTLFKAAEGRLIDTDRIAEYFKNDGTIKAYAKAWAIFIGYHFAYNVFWEKKSVVEALKQVAREIRDEAIVSFFQKRLQAEGAKGKDGMEPITDPIRKLRQGFVARANGQHDCRLDDVLACMRDPQAMRSLKKASPELQDAFNRTREQLYRQHDDQVRAKVSEKTGIPPEDLRIDDFRTPGGAGSNINTDRDYRLLYRGGKDADGNDMWFEVPKEKWQDISYNAFGQLTGKPPGMSDLEWAQKHLQLATDKYHIEASPDYSDHAIDPKTGQKTIIRPNIIAVEEGKSRLIDSTALGNMYHEKVHASLRMNQLSEAIAQCKKGVDTLDKVRAGYGMQGLDTGRLPDSIKKGMEIVRKAPTDQSATPEVLKKFNQELNEAGFHNLEDFSNKLAAQFESLKRYDQQPGSGQLSK